MNGNLYLVIPYESAALAKDELRARLIAAAQAKSWEPIEGPVDLTLMFKMPRPSKLRRKKSARVRLRSIASPTLAVLLATIGDALRNLGWSRPEQIATVRGWKAYTSESDEPELELLVRPMAAEWPQPKDVASQETRESWAKRRRIREP